MDKEALEKLKKHVADMSSNMDKFITIAKKIRQSECTMYIPLVESKTVEIIPMSLEEAKNKVPGMYPKDAAFSLTQEEFEYISKYAVHTLMDKVTTKDDALKSSLAKALEELKKIFKEAEIEDEDGSLANEMATISIFEGVVTKMSDAIIPFEYGIHQTIHKIIYYLHISFLEELPTNCIKLQDGEEGILFFNNRSDDMEKERRISDEIIYEILEQTDDGSIVGLQMINDFVRDYKSAAITTTQNSLGEATIKAVISKAKNEFDDYPDVAYNMGSVKVFTVEGYRNIVLFMATIIKGMGLKASYTQDTLGIDSKELLSTPVVAAAILARNRDGAFEDLSLEIAKICTINLESTSPEHYEVLETEGATSCFKLID